MRGRRLERFDLDVRGENARRSAESQGEFGEWGYDHAWFRIAQITKSIAPCIPSKANHKTRIPHDRVLYRQRKRIENMLGIQKDWRRIHARYDRCAHTFFSTVAIAATVIFSL